MEKKLSELVDGEQDPLDEQRLFDALRQNPALRARWRAYHLAGDALRGERNLSADIAGRVMAALKNEPVALAPRRNPRQDWRQGAMAVAATLAGVAVVAWMALGSPGTSSTLPVQSWARNDAAAQPARQVVAVAVAPVARDMQEYLVAHQAHSGRGMVRGATQHIRTVAATGSMAAK